MTVANTVESLGVNVKSITPTKAELALKNGLTRDAIIRAIEKAGYNVLIDNH